MILFIVLFRRRPGTVLVVFVKVHPVQQDAPAGHAQLRPRHVHHRLHCLLHRVRQGQRVLRHRRRHQTDQSLRLRNHFEGMARLNGFACISLSFEWCI